MNGDGKDEVVSSMVDLFTFKPIARCGTARRSWTAAPHWGSTLRPFEPDLKQNISPGIATIRFVENGRSVRTPTGRDLTRRTPVSAHLDGDERFKALRASRARFHERSTRSCLAAVIPAFEPLFTVAEYDTF